MQVWSPTGGCFRYERCRGTCSHRYGRCCGLPDQRWYTLPERCIAASRPGRLIIHLYQYYGFLHMVVLSGRIVRPIRCGLLEIRAPRTKVPGNDGAGMAVVGVPGSGKTTLLCYATMRTAGDDATRHLLGRSAHPQPPTPPVHRRPVWHHRQYQPSQYRTRESAITKRDAVLSMDREGALHRRVLSEDGAHALVQPECQNRVYLRRVRPQRKGSYEE